MNNTTDLFRPEYKRLTLSTAATTVFVDGVLCADLESIEIVRSGWPEFGWARFAYNPAARQGTTVIASEETEGRFGMGREIKVCQLYNTTPPDVTVAHVPLFVGQIEQIEVKTGSEDDRIEITVRDYSAVLHRTTVYGQRVLHSGDSTAFLPGLETVFNPGGQGNAAAIPTMVDGKTRTTFHAGAAGAKLWSYAEAVNYLLSEHVPRGRLHWPSVAQLLALTENGLARDLDVTGLSLLEALHRCSEAAGVQFHFVPRLAETGPTQAIVFYRNGYRRAVELNCQPKGEILSSSRTNIAAYHGTRHFYPITRRYIGQGDFKVYEATFELVKAWDPALEDTDYCKFSPSTNPEFAKVRDVYRKWCLNEAGDYTGAPYNQGPPYDFSGVFRGEYASHRRRFWPALSADARSDSLGYFLEVSLDDGLNWSAYTHAFNNLLNECGIWLSSNSLDVCAWVAALKDTLRFRITGSVVSDERLTCILADGPVGSAAPVVDQVITLPRRFKYRTVSPQSVLAQEENCGKPDEVDDSAALHEFVRRQRAASSTTIETADVKTPSLSLHFHPGDRIISSPESRDLLSHRRDNRSLTWIERIHMDFRNQCTNLHLVRQRTYEG
jgi:hypothetical protein